MTEIEEAPTAGTGATLLSRVLARELGMSRSSFSDRFNDLVGCGAISHVADWRLQKALAILDQLGISTFIGVMEFRFTRRQAQMQALQLAHFRWQEVNRSIVERPHLQRSLGDARFENKTDDEIVVYNIIFQIMNSCYELHFAKAQALIDREIADRFLDGNADVLRGRNPEVFGMLSWNRGYDKSFCDDMRKRL
jgi:AraC-like DNA-binding protein